MEKRRLNKVIIYITVGVFLAISALGILLHYERNISQQRNYIETGGEIVVIFDKEVKKEYLNTLIASFETPVEVVRHIGDYALLYVKESEEYQIVLQRLQENPQVAAAQENNDIALMGFSNDTYADTQWAIDNPGHYIYLTEAGREEKSAIAGVDMDVLEAWQLYGEGIDEKREVVVAIIDTGVDYAHPDLAERIWINENEVPDDGIDNDNNGYIDDIYGWDFYNSDSSVCHYEFSSEFNTNLSSPKDKDDHGTHVAGIIGAVANNNIGVAGVASNVDIKIMVLKINGGPKGSGNISGAIEAVKYATMMGADIANMSWGTSQYTEALEEVMRESDMLFVAAAGNSGTNNNSSPVYPASLNLDNLISVTFINSIGKMTNLSNYGTSSIDIAAPGEDIFSTIVGNYASMSGSSMAAPQVTSVAAMLYAYSDNLYPSNIREVIINNMKPIKDLEGYIKSAGIPSAYMALKASDSLVKDVDAPELNFETIYNKDEMVIPIIAEDIGGSNIRVLKWIVGDRSLEEFQRGIAGTVVTDNQINVSKAGVYTFYAADYAGNEIIKTYEVKEDTKAPKVKSYYTVAGSYKSRTVIVKASDDLSGIRKAKYMPGTKKSSDFLPADAGNEIAIQDGKGTFKVKKDGIYTVYATDYRGNSIVKQIEIKTVKATGIKFVRNKLSLKVEEQFVLRAFIKPLNTTDQITYTSSDESIATISNRGIIKPLKEGTVNITAKSSSGLTTVCEVAIKK